MSFSITISGHAGPGMAGNSQEEIDAITNVVKDVRESFERNKLNLGGLTVSPPNYAPAELQTPQMLTAET